MLHNPKLHILTLHESSCGSFWTRWTKVDTPGINTGLWVWLCDSDSLGEDRIGEAEWECGIGNSINLPKSVHALNQGSTNRSVRPVHFVLNVIRCQYQLPKRHVQLPVKCVVGFAPLPLVFPVKFCKFRSPELPIGSVSVSTKRPRTIVDIVDIIETT